MSARRDPPRFSEEGPEALRTLMRAVHDRGPSDAAAARIAKQLAMAGVPTAPPAKGTRVAGRWAASHKLSLFAIAALGLSVAAWQATHASSATSADGPGAAVSESVAAESVAPLATEATALAPSTETAPLANTAPSGTAVIAIAELPSASARPRIAQASAPAARVKAKNIAGDIAEASAPSELELLQRAQSALAATPARALAITNEHARAYPSGELVQERELIAVEALARTGQNDQAYERARALMQRFPRTPYVARLELALGRPLQGPDAARAP